MTANFGVEKVNYLHSIYLPTEKKQLRLLSMLESISN